MSLMHDIRTHTLEEIQGMSYDEIMKVVSQYRSLMRNSQGFPDVVRKLEVEICYFQRELHIRDKWENPNRNRDSVSRRKLKV